MALTIADIQASSVDPAVKDLLRKVLANDAAISVIPSNATLRNVATRGRCPQVYGGGPYIFSRTAHINRSGLTMTALALVFATWYSDFAGEHLAASGVTTLNATIEYPAGVLTTVTWQGVAKTTQGNGLTFASDLVTLAVGIPDGAQFWVRNLQFNTGVGIYATAANATTLAMGDLNVMSTTPIPDYTQAVILPANQTTYTYSPVAILGISAKPSVLCIGDSRVYGFQDIAGSTNPALVGANLTLGGLGILARQFDQSFPYTNVGSTGEQAVNFAGGTLSAFRIALQQYHTHVYSNYGINDLTAGTSAATLYGYCSSIINFFPTKKVGWSTIYPVSASTDGWVGGPGTQTVSASNPQRILVNTSIRTFTNGFTKLWMFSDESDAVESSFNSGLYAALRNGLAASPDGTHLSSAALLYLQNAKPLNMAQITG